MDARYVVRKALFDYLGAQPDVDIEEFDVVFDDVYDTLDRRLSEGSTNKRVVVDDGLPFDAMSISDSVIAVACLVAMVLSTAAIKAGGKSLARSALDRLEEKLAAQTGKPKMVSGIRKSIDRILDEL